MGVGRRDSAEEGIRTLVRQIALICLSEDFQELKQELEQIYRQHGVEDPALTAFEDALYAFLAQEEDARPCALSSPNTPKNA